MIGVVPFGPLELIPSGLISLFRSYSNTIPVVRRPYYLVTHASQVLPCIVLIYCIASRRTACGPPTVLNGDPRPTRMHCVDCVGCIGCVALY